MQEAQGKESKLVFVPILGLSPLKISLRLLTASEVTFDLEFELSSLNNLYYSISLGCILLCLTKYSPPCLFFLLLSSFSSNCDQSKFRPECLYPGADIKSFGAWGKGCPSQRWLNPWSLINQYRIWYQESQFDHVSGFNSAFESVKNLVKPLVGYGDEGGERRFDINDRTKVYFDIEVDGVYEGRINLELFDEIVPRTTENFRQLCTRELFLGYCVD